MALYGIGGVQTAGKTGTAERGNDLPPALVVHRLCGRAKPGAAPSIAIAVIVEGAGPGSATAAPIGGQVMAEWLAPERELRLAIGIQRQHADQTNRSVVCIYPV